jgi:DNA-binding transcriptional LysR family regulator
MDLRRLEIFVKVAELASFSRAAQALSLTQPTVSEHVRALEDELGVQLLDRLGRGAAPTRAGQLLLGYAQRMLTLSREARQAIDQFQGRLSGELMIGGSTIPGEYVLPVLIGQFKAKQADISIVLLIGDSHQVSEWVEDGRVEIGVVGARPPQRTLEARELMRDELVVALPAEHAWARRETVSLAELQAEPMVVREHGSGSRAALEHALDEAGTSLAAFRVVAEMGLDAGDQAGGARGRRRFADLPARRRGRVPRRPPRVREDRPHPRRARLLPRDASRPHPLAAGAGLSHVPRIADPADGIVSA